jgi:hypothetical protein
MKDAPEGTGSAGAAYALSLFAMHQEGACTARKGKEIGKSS